MLTLQELKKEVDIPGFDEKTPTARQLRESGRLIEKEELGEDTEICVYRNGYVLYRVGRHSTVFPLYLCKEYVYMSGKNVVCLAEQFFENEKWGLRLMLEGEDRLKRNQDEKERRWNVSRDLVSDKWAVEDGLIESILEHLDERKMVDEVLQSLTGRQREIVKKYFLQEKTQKEIAEELGISDPAVSLILFRAIRRIRRKYRTCNLTIDLYSEQKRENYLETGKENGNAR